MAACREAGDRFVRQPDADIPLEVAELRRAGGTLVVGVTGEIDLRTADELAVRLLELCEPRAVSSQAPATARPGGLDRPPSLLVLDFGEVRFCDATGLGALIAVRNALHARGGAVRIARPRPAQRRLFGLTGLDRMFSLHETVDGAVAAGQAAVGGSQS